MKKKQTSWIGRSRMFWHMDKIITIKIRISPIKNKCLNYKNVIILKTQIYCYFLICVLTKKFLWEIMFKEPHKEVAFSIRKIGEDL